MGEIENQPFQLSFNSSLKIDFQGSRVTSDGGLILVRELDERLDLADLIERHLTDSRRGKNIQLPLADLLCQSLYSHLAGYEGVNNAECLSRDPTFHLIGSEKIWGRGAALTSRLQSFEMELLTQEGNLDGLALINRELIAKAEAIDSPQRVVLEMDSTEIPVYGQQEQSAYNGHFESTCYHPLLLFNQESDCLAAKLRPGNVHSAEHWEELLLPEIARQEKSGKEVVFRADAAFAKPQIQDWPLPWAREALSAENPTCHAFGSDRVYVAGRAGVHNGNSGSDSARVMGRSNLSARGGIVRHISGKILQSRFLG
jgi:hypothetical protein